MINILKITFSFGDTTWGYMNNLQFVLSKTLIGDTKYNI